MDDASKDEFLGEDLRVTTTLMIGPSQRPVTDPVLAQRLIESLDLFDDAHPRGAMPHEDEGAPEVQRLEHKLDLLLHLVAESLHPERPDPVELVLSGRGMVLPAGTLPEDCERVEVYLSRLLPQPCVLGVETPTTRGGQQMTRWTGVEGPLEEALGRWIFRLHRREVAEKRQKVDGNRN
ncbi:MULTISPECIES: PilZ domain-containing protein [unclassified Thioalkalivibrio]|uniref:PilZ domain-containing protein n=1 Tax=unclassified Thioalkalivibrio TaxID=2621013 RepID=UPI00035DB8F5|nr:MULTISPECIES: PilZ domain-containing protein [unclassified Thioalkalivibrio]